ncbi:hypothetical protein [Haloarcula vallismortis]|uniref:hypothetical protein n=1 Tax=Haloarcula vallismortis TaxID=28442 RepID=UPI001F4D1991|nr:hypothetical protein [Haloarcula vallismortis]
MTLTTALLVAVIQQARLERQSIEVAIVDSFNCVEHIPCRTLHEVDSVQEAQRVFDVVRFEPAAGRATELTRDF